MRATETVGLQPLQGERRTEGTPRLAVIGCGAISEGYHLPALAARPELRDKAVLVDRDARRATEMASRFGISSTASDHRDVLEDIDGAVVATPPDTHHRVCRDLIEQQISVLCEKPLVDDPDQARELVGLANERGVVLCLNHTRRFFPASGLIRTLIQSGELGELRSLDYVDGNAFSWPATGFHFRRGSPGVLSDRGVHSLDLICWWLGGKPDLVRSLNDSQGGPESLVWLALQHGDCRVRLKLSWLTKLQNRFRIEGEKGTIEGAIDRFDRVDLTRPSGKVETTRISCPEIQYKDFGARVLGDFLGAMAGEADPAVPAADVIDSLELIEEAYRTARPLHLPWAFDGERD